ncbi:MAG: hypothetical protein ACRES7_05280 [Gammaproteobacteria bacterium]
MKAGRTLLFGSGMTLLATVGWAGSAGVSAAAPGTSGMPAAPGCAPPSATYRVYHPARVSTVQPVVSPPLTSLPPAPASPATTAKRVIPLGRIKPWSERCPPPPPPPTTDN